MNAVPSKRMIGTAISAALLLAACNSDVATSDADAVEPLPTSVDNESGDDAGGLAGDSSEGGALDDEPGDDETGNGGEFNVEADDDAGEAPAAAIDPSLQRDDVDCAADMLDFSGTTPFTDAHYVVGGVLGAPCLGDGDETLTDAWNVLAAITPPGQLGDLGLFGAFEGGDEGDEATLAFVNPLDSDGTLFQMSVNLETYRADPGEALLTMAHEFSHVFTALPSQIDRSDESAVGCTTYDNGEGCFAPDALLAQWVMLFWGNGLIDQIDVDAEPTGAEGQVRCDNDPGFLGPYAASNPEEDFAESFSAFVFQLEVFTPEMQAKLDWMGEQPGLVEFRDRATATGLGPPPNNFEGCGPF